MFESIHSSRYHIVPTVLLLICSMSLGACFAGATGHAAGKGGGQAPGEQRVERDPWLSAWKAVLEEDRLYLYAVKLFGAPTGCEGKITATFEDEKFGIMRFAFAAGSELQIETAPPETTRLTLKVPGGFPNENEARAILEQYVREIGLKIDWSKPVEETTADGNTKILRYSDRGLDATAVMVYKGGKLIEMGYQMAL